MNSGQLHTVSRAVDPKFELGVLLSLRDRGPTMLFQNNGTSPVVGNLLASRQRFAQGLGIASDELDARCLAALKHPIKPVMIAKGAAQEVVHSGLIYLAKLLPVPTWFERETGPYIKLVTVVDYDIDIEKLRAVEWALAARFRGDEDLVVVDGVKADRCEPLHDELTVTKIGMIATTRPW